MVFSSISTPGSERMSEPVAMTMLRVSISSSPPSLSAIATLPGAAMRPWPAKLVILFFLNSPAMPLVRFETTPSLRAISAFRSMSSDPVLMPWSAK